MKIPNKKKLTSIVVSIILFAIVFALDRAGVIDINDLVEENDAYISTNSSSDGLYEVTRVVDGDTFVINFNGTEEKIRLIGVDTPESVHPNKEKNTTYGKTASEYTKDALLGKKVSLELDVQERDKYGRILAYVYLDGKMYNETLLEEGYAKVATYPPNVKYVDNFTKLEKKARTSKVGLWGLEEE